VVTGLPGAGKSTLINHHANSGDLVFDYDAILRTIVVGLRDKRDNPSDLIELGEALRNAFISFVRASATSRSVYVISANKRSAKAQAAKLGASLLDLG
jgi:adenylate kinase